MFILKRSLYSGFYLEKNFKIWIIFIYPFPAGGVQTRINPDSPSAKDLDNTGHLVGILQGADLMPANNSSNNALGILKGSFYNSFSYPYFHQFKNKKRILY